MSYQSSSGFLVIEQLLDTSQVQGVLGACDLLRASAIESHPGDKLHGGTVHLENLAQRIDAVAMLVSHPSLRAVVDEIAGAEAKLVQSSLRCPRPGYGAQHPHTDDVPKLDDGPCRVATAIVALTQFTSDNGATRIVPGSHRRPDLQRRGESNAPVPGKRIIELQAGDALVFSGHLLHSGTKNTSALERPALQLIWRRE